MSPRNIAKNVLHKVVGDRLYSRWASIRSRDAQVRQIRGSRVYACTEALIERYGTTVLNGPFRGMRYPKEALLNRLGGPKLLGSYECELHPVIDGVVWPDFKKVLDIGCAEGYYAVGISRLFGGDIYAFDTEPREGVLCRELAIINEVSDRVFTRDWADHKTLVEHCSGKRCFVMCDCEGYEIKLLTQAAVAALEYSDLLIEVHEKTVPGVSEHLQSSLARTHVVGTRHARPRLVSEFPATEFLGSDAELVLNEKRSDGLTWIWGRSRAAIA